MARTTESEVRDIVETDIDNLTPLIESANVFVDENLQNQGLSSSLLAEIERYIAGHLTHLSDPQEKSASIGDASFHFRGEDGMGLNQTPQGQMAVTMDSTGTLARLSKSDKSESSFEAVGVDI